MKRLMILLFVVFILIPSSVFAATDDDSPILSIVNLFYYEPGINDENPEQTREANEAYRSMIAGLVKKSDYRFTSEALTWNVNETLATDDFTAATWQVTNTSDKILYVQSNEFLITFNGIAYDVAGGYHWHYSNETGYNESKNEDYIVMLSSKD